ncbi:putative NAD-binding protein [Lyophyllum shimeji]|uniref:NAD-binding protein n=1 Tax=Lyophyllum shimeji TaxID=47721 RepID=A0A9P3PTC1_LYOSH|nr:putative NAD-binding protein [Lyophyllum shimeji]
MSTPKINILLTGAKGYIGGAVLSRFLARADVASLSITITLIRSHEKAQKLKALSVNAVVGSHETSALVQELASEADVADSEHVEAAKATLRSRGPLQSHRYCPHTHPYGVLMDNAGGAYATDVVYDDATPDQFETLAPTRLHRDVDLLLVDADRLGYVRTYLILPCTIYGPAIGMIVEHGIPNVHSIQIPSLIKASLDRGQGGMDKPRHGTWSSGLLLRRERPAQLVPSRQGYSEALVAIERGKTAEPTTLTKDEIDEYFGGSWYLGSNALCTATHAHAIGRKPSKTTADMLASIKPEVEATLRSSRLRLTEITEEVSGVRSATGVPTVTYPYGCSHDISADFDCCREAPHCLLPTSERCVQQSNLEAQRYALSFRPVVSKRDEILQASVLRKSSDGQPGL